MCVCVVPVRIYRFELDFGSFSVLLLTIFNFIKLVACVLVSITQTNAMSPLGSVYLGDDDDHDGFDDDYL